MYGLSVGVSNISETLPRAAYTLLSGLNAATVGIIALAAVELSRKAITDKITRILVFLGAAAGMLYNTLWYFPLLMLLSTVWQPWYTITGRCISPSRQLCFSSRRHKGAQRREKGLI